jgi:protein tyrosine/serine phosphatase
MEGINNFRQVKDVFGGRLHRSGHLHGATLGDREALRRIGFGLIVDLRRPAERRLAPSPDLGIETATTSLDGQAMSPHMGFLEAGDLRPEAIGAYLLGYYQAAPFAVHAKPLFGVMLEALSRDERQVLVHCTAGKDRTGLAVAIAQSAAGTSREEIILEYLRSNDALGDPRFRLRAAATIRAACGQKPSDYIIDAFAGVHPSHIEAALDAIEWSGGMQRYLGSLNRPTGL